MITMLVMLGTLIVLMAIIWWDIDRRERKQ